MGQHCGIWQTERCCLNISSVKDKADWNNKSRSNLVASTWVGVTMWRHSAVGSMFVHILKLIPFNLFFLSLASIPVPRIWILDSAKYEQVTFATLPRFTAVSGVYASMCVYVCVCVRARCQPEVWGHLHLQMGVSCQWGEGLPFYSPAVLESIGCIICSSWINILMENYKEDEHLETKACRPRAENKQDCTSPRRWRPRNWLPTHLLFLYSFYSQRILFQSLIAYFKLSSSSRPLSSLSSSLPVPSLRPPKWYSLCH